MATIPILDRVQLSAWEVACPRFPFRGHHRLGGTFYKRTTSQQREQTSRVLASLMTKSSKRGSNLPGTPCQCQCKWIPSSCIACFSDDKARKSWCHCFHFRFGARDRRIASAFWQREGNGGSKHGIGRYPVESTRSWQSTGYRRREPYAHFHRWDK